MNSFPVNLFFIPAYAPGLITFFAHLDAIHAQKMKYTRLGMGPHQQILGIIAAGLLSTGILMLSFKNKGKGFQIPDPYHILISE